MRLALAQLNPLVGDLTGNTKSILRACDQAEAGQADLLLTPELSSGATHREIRCSRNGWPSKRRSWVSCGGCSRGNPA